jgi:Helicase associated domain
LFPQDCLVPHGYDIDPSFAEWIHRQRTTYAAMIKEKKPNQMVIDRMAKLKDMDFNFTVHSDKWTEHWLLLKEYKEKHGNCQVPTHYAENPKLGRWTHTQRHQRRLQIKGKKSCMTKERIELLDQLGFSWEVRPAMVQPRATWQQRYDELKDFYQTYNHFVIPADTHPSLHLWSHEQKSRLRNLDVSGKVSSPRMGPDRVAALEELGFTKDTPLADLDLQQIDTDETESLEVDEPQQPVVVAAQVAVEGAAADDHEAATLLAVNDAVESVVNEGMDASATTEPIDTTNFATQSV